jgi:hypothetical protein
MHWLFMNLSVHIIEFVDIEIETDAYYQDQCMWIGHTNTSFLICMKYTNILNRALGIMYHTTITTQEILITITRKAAKGIHIRFEDHNSVKLILKNDRS